MNQPYAQQLPPKQQQQQQQQRWQSDLKRPREDDGGFEPAGRMLDVRGSDVVYSTQRDGQERQGVPMPPPHAMRQQENYYPPSHAEQAPYAADEMPRAPKKSFSADSDGNISVGQVSNNRKVKVRIFSGKVLIDIREYYKSNDGKELPGKKGISLTVEQWKELKKMPADVDAAIASLD